MCKYKFLKVWMQIHAGEKIDDAIKTASALAEEHKCEVEFDFNGTTWLIKATKGARP